MSKKRAAYAVIVAGGSGQRMGTAVPKQFLELCGKPMLYWSIKAFMEALPDVHIILVLPATQISIAQIVLQAFPERIDLTIVAGGDTRHGSVANGLKEVPEDAIVLVHDGARPLASAELIGRCYKAAATHGSAIPVIPVADSIREEINDSSRAIARDRLRVVQTPQAFDAALLKHAFDQSYDPSFTDEATVAEADGIAIYLVSGERSNLKITTPDDMIIAAAILHHRLRDKAEII
jgi:2-C-methyl-D-erythritol 4-phosphate cytidylyltransferase